MAVLRSLLVTLGLQSAQYRGELEKSRKETKQALGQMSEGFKSFGQKATAATVAVTGAAVAFSKNMQQTNALAVSLGYTFQQMEALSLVASSAGLSVEQMGNQFKDVQEKVGEFVSTGGGGMQDFFDVMRMGAKESALFAEEMKKLSGPEILSRMVSEMERAGVSSKEMSFALEGMGSDLTLLLPMLTDGAQKFNEISKEAAGVANAVTSEHIEKWNSLATSVDTLMLSMKTAATVGLAPFAEALGDVTDKISNFFQSFTEGTIANVRFKINSVTSEIEKIEGRLSGRDLFAGGVFYTDYEKSIDQKNLNEFKARLASYEEEYKKLKDLADKPIAPPKVTPAGGGDKPNDKPLKLPKKTLDQLEREAKELKKKQAEIFNDMYGGTDTVDLNLLNLSKQKRAEYDLLLESLDEQNELLTDRYNKEAELLLENATSYEEYIKYKEQLDRNYAASNLQITSAMFGGLSEAAKVFAGEQSGIYKALFAAEKMYHNASIIMSSYDAIAKAWASAPFPANIPAVLQTTVETGALSAALQSVSMVGMAHDGIDEVPKEGTWLLQKGERVVDSRTNADLKNALKGGMGGGNMSVTVDLRGTTGDKELDRKLKESARAAYSMVLSDARSNGAIYKNMRK